MNKAITLLIVLFTISSIQPLLAQDKKVKKVIDKKEISSKNDSLWYALGLAMSRQFDQEIFGEADYAAMMKGFKEGRDSTNKLSIEDAQQFVGEFYQNKKKEIDKAKHAKNIEEEKDFLAKNAKRAGVQTTASGLQYEVLTAGQGEKPYASDEVTVHYKGYFVDGEVFDSSYDRGEPATFKLNRVIPGWTEGVQLMNVGSKYKFFIPSELAYGDRGGRIPPYKMLIFEIELISVGE